MDILSIAEDNFLISLSVVLIVGLIQGLILGRGIRKKFPSFKTHARLVSILLLTLFTINTIANIIKFAIPEKFSLSEMIVPTTPEEGLSFLFNMLGLNTGFGTAIAMFISITLILIFRFAEIPNIARYFIFALSVITVSAFFLGRFTDFVPTFFQIMLYALYQFGITIGVFVITRRRESDDVVEFK